MTVLGWGQGFITMLLVTLRVFPSGDALSTSGNPLHLLLTTIGAGGRESNHAGTHAKGLLDGGVWVIYA